ncbi:hypothetical protein LCGC14_2951830, partial [marine sediment metagenome]
AGVAAFTMAAGAATVAVAMVRDLRNCRLFMAYLLDWAGDTPRLVPAPCLSALF